MIRLCIIRSNTLFTWCKVEIGRYWLVELLSPDLKTVKYKDLIYHNPLLGLFSPTKPIPIKYSSQFGDKINTWSTE